MLCDSYMLGFYKEYIDPLWHEVFINKDFTKHDTRVNSH